MMANDGGGIRMLVSEKFGLHSSMVALQFAYAGFHIVSRVALNMGMSKIVYAIYRNILAMLSLLPFAYFLEKKERPPITWNLLLQFFLCAMFGITGNQGLYLVGLGYTSPTFASAIQNSVPAITFLLASIFRIEKVRLDKKHGIAKVAGTFVCVAGASVITLYKGPIIYGPNLRPPNSPPTTLTEADYSKNWTLGCLFLIAHCLSWATWLVLQSTIVKKYPARLSFTTYQCFFGVIQFLAIAAVVERDAGAWRFHSAGELYSVVYAGVVALGIALPVQVWCIDRGGPVFVAVYQPVQTVSVAVMASILLGEQFYLGGIIGAVVIIVGLYLVIWGKNEEMKQWSSLDGVSSVDEPLLDDPTEIT